MLAPFCEGEAGHELVRELGVESLALWRRAYPDLPMRGSLAVAAARDQPDLTRFARLTHGHRTLDAGALGQLEPALEGRFGSALFYEEEGHVEPESALGWLASAAAVSGVSFADQAPKEAEAADFIVDCRGIAAKDELKTLRGVRGERLVIECPEVSLTRPVRLLHPRIPFYIVPWRAGRFMVGATLIESEDAGPMTLRSAFELLSAAYALQPAFGEARVVDMAAGVRPAFPDNLPKIVARGCRIFVNGLYRHGFLLSPILAEMTADYIERGALREGIIVEDYGEW
jgi:glycine oxidase